MKNTLVKKNTDSLHLLGQEAKYRTALFIQDCLLAASYTLPNPRNLKRPAIA